MLLGLIAIPLAAGALRWGVVLLLGSSLGLMVVAPATAIWSARYAVPASGPIVAAGAIGAWLLVVRLRSIQRPRPSRPAGLDSPGAVILPSRVGPWGFEPGSNLRPMAGGVLSPRNTGSATEYVEFNRRPLGGHRLMLAMIPPGGRVLDVGCSGGYLAERLVGAGAP